MKTAWNAPDRSNLQDRLMALGPGSSPRWGRLSAPQMICHLAESLRMASGDLVAAPKQLPIRFTPLKQLLIYCVPIPKGAPTLPELLAREPAAWEADVAEVRHLLDQLAARKPDGNWPDHPAFGRLHGRTWGVLVYRHMDHHLRQFGV